MSPVRLIEVTTSAGVASGFKAQPHIQTIIGDINPRYGFLFRHEHKIARFLQFYHKASAAYGMRHTSVNEHNIAFMHRNTPQHIKKLFGIIILYCFSPPFCGNIGFESEVYMRIGRAVKKIPALSLAK